MMEVIEIIVKRIARVIWRTFLIMIGIALIAIAVLMMCYRCEITNSIKVAASVMIDQAEEYFKANARK